MSKRFHVQDLRSLCTYIGSIQPRWLCRVHKFIDEFDKFAAEISRGTQPDKQFEIISNIYQKAREQAEQHFMANATSLPSLSKHRRYSVKLQAYGLPANPQTLQVRLIFLCPVKITLLLSGEITLRLTGALSEVAKIIL